MALDTVDHDSTYLNGGVIIPQPDLLDIIIEQERHDRQKDTRQRIGVTVPGLYDMPPMPPRRPVSDDRMTDDGDSYRGYVEFDM